MSVVERAKMVLSACEGLRAIYFHRYFTYIERTPYNINSFKMGRHRTSINEEDVPVIEFYAKRKAEIKIKEKFDRITLHR